MKKIITLSVLILILCTSIVNIMAQVCNVTSGAISASPARTFCSGDGIADIVSVSVTGAVGTNYRIIYSNANGIIQAIQQGNSFNFEGWSSTTVNAVGISYENGLQGLAVGNSIGNLTGCFALSITGFTITIFSKEAGSISTQGSTTVSVCTNDHIADIVPITYAGFDAFGLVFATTDLNDNITAIDFNVPNFEGTGQGIVKLRIITSCLETFVIPIGTNISQLPSNMDFSNAITITKTTCSTPVCAPEVKACPGKVLLCINGVSTCVDQKQVSKLLRSGATRGGCIVCTPGQANARSAVNELVTETASIYPNPNNGSFNIRNLNTGNVKYELRDLTGKILWTKIIYQYSRENSISVEGLNLKDGIYYLHTSTDKTIHTKRLIIQNGGQ